MGRGLLSLILLVAVASTGCASVFHEMTRDPDFEPVGPRVVLGPIPRFDADGADITDPDSSLVWFRTRDGHCTEQNGGSGCSGGGPGGGLPRLEDGLGFGSTEGGGEICIKTVAAKEIVRMEVNPGDGATVQLRPLAGGDAIPVAVFAACWEDPGMRSRQISATGFTADGREIPGM